MKRYLCLAAALVVAAGAWPLSADQCQLQFISHGTLRDLGGCLIFEDDLGELWEVTNPKGNWRDGQTGTVYAEFLPQGSCSELPALRVCRFEADFTKNVSGTLILTQFIECPGYVIQTPNQNYLILNCEDFGDALCAPANLGRRLKATVFVDTGISICLGQARSTVLDYRFIQ